MSDQKIFPVLKEFSEKSNIDKNTYKSMYQNSIKDPESFWKEHGKCIDWIDPYTKVKETSFYKDNINIKWFFDGTLNASENCLDRHLLEQGDKIAIYWEGDDPSQSKKITYKELYKDVCKFSNSLRKLNVKKGDRIVLYIPMIPESIVSMLACARIGAIHSVVFGGFSAEALASRIKDCKAKIVITADQGFRRGKIVHFKKNTDKALSYLNEDLIENIIVVKRSGNSVPWDNSINLWYHEIINNELEDSKSEIMNAEDPLFILYTSGSTGKPKGVLHTTGGYMVYAHMTFKYIFDYKKSDIYFCTADIGWITGHTYVVYGPLSVGASIVIFEGVPDYPDTSRFWEIVDKYKVTTFYTAPTAIRALLNHGDEPVKKFKRSSLRLLGSVGEPIDASSWKWYHKVVGNSKCPIVDTWWQTETGGILISPIPGVSDLKPGSVAKPFFGIEPVIIDKDGEVVQGSGEGNLVIRNSWPGQMRTVYSHHERFIETYFKKYPGYFFTGDGARVDKDGYFWITGRIDDVINVAGHRIATADVESAINSHPKISESASVGFPHKIKGQGIYVFVNLIEGEKPSEELRVELEQWLREKIGPIGKPDVIQWTKSLPKTRSGKIIRRILRKIAANDYEDLGDISTLADQSVVDNLIKNRKNL